jgi:hypothetical protein
MMLQTFVLASLLTGIFTAAPEEVDFKTALKNAAITANAKGNSSSTHYLKPLMLELRNRKNTQIVVKLPAGLWFQSEDSAVQDIITTNTEYLVLKANETKTFPINGLCIQHQNAAPGNDDAFVFNPKTRGNLSRFAQKIDSADWQNGQAQSAMWAIADKTDLRTIYSYGDETEWKIACEAAKIMGVAKPDKQTFEAYAAKQPVYKSELRGKFKFKFSQKVAIHIALFDANGIVLQEIYREEAPPGQHEVEYTFDAKPYEGQTIYAKFIARDDVLMTRTIAL